jgi:hypothetical protein
LTIHTTTKSSDVVCDIVNRSSFATLGAEAMGLELVIELASALTGSDITELTSSMTGSGVVSGASSWVGDVTSLLTGWSGVVDVVAGP